MFVSLLSGVLLVFQWGFSDAFVSSNVKFGISSTKLQATPPAPYPPILPFDPRYKTQGIIGTDSVFTISRSGEPTDEELDFANIVKCLIQFDDVRDLEVNTLVWKCLGYRFDEEEQKWNNDEVFPKWRKSYPEPPDFINMQRVWSKEVDEPSLRATQSLIKTIPSVYKKHLKVDLLEYGFKGFTMDGLTPTKTRRAQCCTFIIYYVQQLRGFTLEELKEKQRLRKEAEAEELEERIKKNPSDNWQYPEQESF